MCLKLPGICSRVNGAAHRAELWEPEPACLKLLPSAWRKSGCAGEQQTHSAEILTTVSLRKSGRCFFLGGRLKSWVFLHVCPGSRGTRQKQCQAVLFPLCSIRTLLYRTASFGMPAWDRLLELAIESNSWQMTVTSEWLQFFINIYCQFDSHVSTNLELKLKGTEYYTCLLRLVEFPLFMEKTSHLHISLVSTMASLRFCLSQACIL